MLDTKAINVIFNGNNLIFPILFFIFLGRASQIERLEREIEEERHMADNLVSAMQPGLRDRYLELKNQNVQYQKDLEDMNQALDALNSKKAT